jgi:LPPG:FO 2-phospho-L-lactate transferase
MQAVRDNDIHIIANVGNDMEFWGLHISPDIDTILYTLSDRLGTDRGWGLRGDTFRCLEAVSFFKLPTWFRPGDADLATHLFRTGLLRGGLKLDEVVERLTSAMSIRPRIIPATNDAVRTRIETAGGFMSYQEFLHHEPSKQDVRSIVYAGAAEARATEAAVDSIREAEMVILAPSNPMTSIGPILAVRAIREALRCTRADVIAISPIIGNAAVSGPAAQLMEAAGYEASPCGVARCYHDILDNIVIDTADLAHASSIRYETIGVHVTNIRITDVESARKLAEFVVNIR